MKAKFFLFLLTATFLAVSCCNTAKNVVSESNQLQNEQNMKKIIAAHLTLKPEKIALFLNFTTALIEKSRTEEGNISYTLYQNPNDPLKFLFFEEWKSQDAIDIHFATEHFQEFDKTIGEYIAEPPVITIYDVAAEK